MKLNIKISTFARIGALLVALANQCLAIFGKGVLPFTENMAYQAVSLAAVAIIAAINAWYNNDISRIALLCGKLFDAISDGKITEEEIEKMLAETENDTNSEDDGKGNNFIINAINKFLKSIKNKNNKE